MVIENAEPQTEAVNSSHQLLKGKGMNAGDMRSLENVPQEDTLQDPAHQPKLEHKVEEANQIVAQLLEVADTFRMTFFKAMNLAQSVSHPPSTKEQTNLTHRRPRRVRRISVPFVDPTDSASAIDILRAFDHDNILEAIKNTGSIIRKRRKQCKEYRVAKEKRSFRNLRFSCRRGTRVQQSLGLHLTVREIPKPSNAALPHYSILTLAVASSVSSPHDFLKATGLQVKVLRSREWVVGRITTITKRFVGPNVCRADMNSHSVTLIGFGWHLCLYY